MLSDSTVGIHVGSTSNLDFQMDQDLSTGKARTLLQQFLAAEARSAVLPAQASECIRTLPHHRKLPCSHLSKMEKEPFLKAKQT